MKKVFALLTLVAFVAITASAFGQAQPAPQGPADLVFKVSSAKGTYIQFAQQIAQVCSTPSISISTSDGQLGLYNDLIANKANVGMLTAPILIGKKTVELDTNVDKIVVIMPLYAAELHIVALRSNSQVNKFTDVGNKKVATYGGAFITSRIVLSQAQLRPFSSAGLQERGSSPPSSREGRSRRRVHRSGPTGYLGGAAERQPVQAGGVRPYRLAGKERLRESEPELQEPEPDFDSHAGYAGLSRFPELLGSEESPRHLGAQGMHLEEHRDVARGNRLPPEMVGSEARCQERLADVQDDASQRRPKKIQEVKFEREIDDGLSF
jgi:hypothetical protein